MADIIPQWEMSEEKISHFKGIALSAAVDRAVQQAFVSSPNELSWREITPQDLGLESWGIDPVDAHSG